MDEILEQAMNTIGIGKTHHKVLLATAFGTFVDAMEVSMMGLILAELKLEWNISEENLAVVPSCTSLGMMIGAVGFGKISDVYGRRLAFQCSLFMVSLFGLLSSFAQNVSTFACLRFFLGIGYGGNILSSTALLAEFMPKKERGFYVMLMGIGYGIGSVTMAGMAQGLMPIIGWRGKLQLAAFLATPVLIALFFVPESCRFYVMRGRYKECVAVLKKNGKRK